MDGSGPAGQATPYLSRQRRDAGQRPAAEELERRAAAGRDVRDPVGDAGLLDRRDRIAAADDGRALDVRHRPRDGVGAGGERRRSRTRPSARSRPRSSRRRSSRCVGRRSSPGRCRGPADRRSPASPIGQHLVRRAGVELGRSRRDRPAARARRRAPPRRPRCAARRRACRLRRATCRSAGRAT